MSMILDNQLQVAQEDLFLKFFHLPAAIFLNVIFVVVTV